MKRVLCALFLTALSSVCFAEDGLVIQFHIEKISADDQVKSSYINAVLMTFDEEHSFDIEDLYVIKFYPMLGNARRLNLVTTLKEVKDGKSYYVGAKEVVLDVGETQTMDLERNNSSFRVKVDTSYGTLP